MLREFKIPYGVRGEKGVHVSEVESGLQEDVTCIECGGKLVARKGSKTAHHFAHHHASSCEGESILHKWGQRLLLERMEEAIENGTEIPFEWDCEFCRKVHRRNLVRKARQVEKEFTLKGGERRPRADLVLLDSKSKPYVAVEIVFTHAPEDWVIDTYRELGVTRVEFSLKDEKDLELLANGETLKADKVDWCEMPKCECGRFFRPRVVHLVDADCWKCHSDMVIAYGTGSCGAMWPMEFTLAERKVAEKQGAHFSVQYSRMARERYLANTCSFCKKISGNNFLHDHCGDESIDIEISMECSCGKHRDFSAVNPLPLSKAARTVLGERNIRHGLKVYRFADSIDFGKQFVGRTVKEMMKADISYAKWCLEKTFFFCMDPEEIMAWNESAETDSRIGGKYRKMNFDKLDKLKAEEL
jgi:ssDNA-binding Zn-finger/Zn-ribbon topoisomerase 1